MISGPSGVGKDTLIERMSELGHDHHFTVTATTRTPRPGEKEGVNHYFLERDTFINMIASDELLEWAEVYGNYYGVPKQQVRTMSYSITPPSFSISCQNCGYEIDAISAPSIVTGDSLTSPAIPSAIAIRWS